MEATMQNIKVTLPVCRYEVFPGIGKEIGLVKRK